MTGTLSFGYDRDRGLGDRLLAAVLRGEKTATSSLAVEYLSGEPLPQVGQRRTLVDHDGRPHGVVETTRVAIIPLNLVGTTSRTTREKASPTQRSGAGTMRPSGPTSRTLCVLTQATLTGNFAMPNPSSCPGPACGDWRRTKRNARDPVIVCGTASARVRQLERARSSCLPRLRHPNAPSVSVPLTGAAEGRCSRSRGCLLPRSPAVPAGR